MKVDFEKSYILRYLSKNAYKSRLEIKNMKHASNKKNEVEVVELVVLIIFRPVAHRDHFSSDAL